MPAAPEIKTLFELCNEMVAAGYEYAHLNTKLDYCDFKPELEVDLKPRVALFYSKLVEPWGVDDDDNNPKQYAPDWYNKLVSDDWRVEEYGMRNITFAKLASGGIHVLKQELDADLLTLHRRDVRFCGCAMPRFDWPQLQQRGYKGIMVTQPESDMEPFGTWDVESLAVWDLTALTSVRSFRNAGKPYEYEVF
jgi:hypothetical protein